VHVLDDPVDCTGLVIILARALFNVKLKFTHYPPAKYNFRIWDLAKLQLSVQIAYLWLELACLRFKPL
jgi:hypothetical protein